MTNPLVETRPPAGDAAPFRAVVTPTAAGKRDGAGQRNGPRNGPGWKESGGPKPLLGPRACLHGGTRWRWDRVLSSNPGATERAQPLNLIRAGPLAIALALCNRSLAAVAGPF